MTRQTWHLLRDHSNLGFDQAKWWVNFWKRFIMTTKDEDPTSRLWMILWFCCRGCRGSARKWNHCNWTYIIHQSRMSKTSQQLVGSSHLYLATQIARYTQLLTISLRADLWHCANSASCFRSFLRTNMSVKWLPIYHKYHNMPESYNIMIWYDIYIYTYT